MTKLSVRRFAALGLVLIAVLFVGSSALAAGGITTVTITNVVTMTVTKGADFANIVTADLLTGTKSVSGAWTIQVDAISNYTLNAQLTLAEDNTAVTPVVIDPTSLSMAASAQAGGTALASTAFVDLLSTIALAGGGLPFTGVNNAGTGGGANISSVDLVIDLSKLGDRSSSGDGSVVNYTLDFIVAEA